MPDKGPGVGFEYPRKEVAWNQRDALLFANTVGCTADELHFLYVCCTYLLFPRSCNRVTYFRIGTSPQLCHLPNLSHHLV